MRAGVLPSLRGLWTIWARHPQVPWLTALLLVCFSDFRPELQIQLLSETVGISFPLVLSTECEQTGNEPP